jgi:3,4-dihydroxy 2-butanone 4-phosphate synthase/GTP cyclohydrolase II
VTPLERLSDARIPTVGGEFRLRLYRTGDGKEHMAFVRGEVARRRDVLVRIHSECFTGDVLGSLRCDCGDQLRAALERIAAEGAGVLVYLRQEGRGIGLAEKLRAYNLQDLGYDTVDANLLLGHAADARDYGPAAGMLADLEVASVRLLSNNPAKVRGLEEAGIEVTDRLPLVAPPHADNVDYLRTKASRMEHRLELPEGLEVGRAAPTPRPVGGNGHRAAPAGRKGLARLLGWIDAEGARRRAARRQGSPSTRPLVTLSYAQSVDGSIAAVPGQPLALSGPESMVLTHHLRAHHGAILVGIGTVLADDPRLTVRLGSLPDDALAGQDLPEVSGALSTAAGIGGDPQPVVVDSALRFPVGARMLAGGDRAPWIATTEDAPVDAERRLVEAGARVIRLPAGPPGPEGEPRVDLAALLDELGRRGIDTLMVEGGARIITSFLHGRLVDQLVLTVAPTLVGGLRALHGPPAGVELPAAPRLTEARYQRLGDDLVLWGTPVWGGPPSPDGDR